jgi:GTP-binding protein
MAPPSVVIVGRPNVGKSTLFNRISGTRRVIVAPVPGTTRDVIAHPAEWRDRRFELVDTGGMFGASDDPLHELVLEGGRRAIARADVLVLVVDGREGLVPGDYEIARVVHEANVPALVAVNKTDDSRARGTAPEFYQLGFDQVFEISAEHADGVGDLLDAILEQLPDRTGIDSPGTGEGGRAASGAEELGEPHGTGTASATIAGSPQPGARSRHLYSSDAGEVAVAIVGRPNAGKSSLMNRLLREDRMLVSETPGTTRDAVDAVLAWHGQKFRFVDTAGIRRPGRVARSGQIESVSVLLARRAIAAADIVVLVVDASVGATDQDAAIAGEADRAGRGVVIVANKWDLVKDRGSDFVKSFDETLRRQLKFLDYAPVLHISAATGERTHKLLEMIEAVSASRRTRVKTPELNRFVQEVTAAHPPASPGRKLVRILYAAQTAVAPPTFVFFTNVATSFHFSYERFLVNALREAFGFMGTPVRLRVRRRPERVKGERTAFKRAQRADTSKPSTAQSRSRSTTGPSGSKGYGSAGRARGARRSKRSTR